ncbi:hypothetical protein HDU76_003281 [Blyttiomyces sp. JEL0837]|nr:hypothetical protein HDU76_003281 [Blyttiomyces sp. JEL0837]
MINPISTTAAGTTSISSTLAGTGKLPPGDVANWTEAIFAHQDGDNALALQYLKQIKTESIAVALNTAIVTMEIGDYNSAVDLISRVFSRFDSVVDKDQRLVILGRWIRALALVGLGQEPIASKEFMEIAESLMVPQNIDFTALGIPYTLYIYEVRFNAAVCLWRIGMIDDSAQELADARPSAATQLHIDSFEAVMRGGFDPPGIFPFPKGLLLMPTDFKSRGNSLLDVNSGFRIGDDAMDGLPDRDESPAPVSPDTEARFKWAERSDSVSTTGSKKVDDIIGAHQNNRDQDEDDDDDIINKVAAAADFGAIPKRISSATASALASQSSNTATSVPNNAAYMPPPPSRLPPPPPIPVNEMPPLPPQPTTPQPTTPTSPSQQPRIIDPASLDTRSFFLPSRDSIIPPVPPIPKEFLKFKNSGTATLPKDFGATMKAYNNGGGTVPKDFGASMKAYAASNGALEDFLSPTSQQQSQSASGQASGQRGPKSAWILGIDEPVVGSGRNIVPPPVPTNPPMLRESLLSPSSLAASIMNSSMVSGSSFGSMSDEYDSGNSKNGGNNGTTTAATTTMGAMSTDDAVRELQAALAAARSYRDSWEFAMPDDDGGNGPRVTSVIMGLASVALGSASASSPTVSSPNVTTPSESGWGSLSRRTTGATVTTTSSLGGLLNSSSNNVTSNNPSLNRPTSEAVSIMSGSSQTFSITTVSTDNGGRNGNSNSSNGTGSTVTSPTGSSRPSSTAMSPVMYQEPTTMVEPTYVPPLVAPTRSSSRGSIKTGPLPRGTSFGRSGSAGGGLDGIKEERESIISESVDGKDNSTNTAAVSGSDVNDMDAEMEARKLIEVMEKLNRSAMSPISPDSNLNLKNPQVPNGNNLPVPPRGASAMHSVMSVVNNNQQRLAGNGNSPTLTGMSRSRSATMDTSTTIDSSSLGLSSAVAAARSRAATLDTNSINFLAGPSTGSPLTPKGLLSSGGTNGGSPLSPRKPGTPGTPVTPIATGPNGISINMRSSSLTGSVPAYHPKFLANFQQQQQQQQSSQQQQLQSIVSPGGGGGNNTGKQPAVLYSPVPTSPLHSPSMLSSPNSRQRSLPYSQPEGSGPMSPNMSGSKTPPPLQPPPPSGPLSPIAGNNSNIDPALAAVVAGGKKDKETITQLLHVLDSLGAKQEEFLAYADYLVALDDILDSGAYTLTRSSSFYRAPSEEDDDDQSVTSAIVDEYNGFRVLSIANTDISADNRTGTPSITDLTLEFGVNGDEDDINEEEETSQVTTLERHISPMAADPSLSRPVALPSGLFHQHQTATTLYGTTMLNLTGESVIGQNTLPPALKPPTRAPALKIATGGSGSGPLNRTESPSMSSPTPRFFMPPAQSVADAGPTVPTASRVTFQLPPTTTKQPLRTPTTPQNQSTVQNNVAVSSQGISFVSKFMDTVYRHHRNTPQSISSPILSSLSPSTQLNNTLPYVSPNGEQIDKETKLANAILSAIGDNPTPTPTTTTGYPGTNNNNNNKNNNANPRQLLQSLSLPDMESYLQVRIGPTGVWKKRWCVLRAQTFYIVKSPANLVPIAILPLGKWTEVLADEEKDNSAVTAAVAGENGGKVFTVKVVSKKEEMGGGSGGNGEVEAVPVIYLAGTDQLLIMSWAGSLVKAVKGEKKTGPRYLIPIRNQDRDVSVRNTMTSPVNTHLRGRTASNANNGSSTSDQDIVTLILDNIFKKAHFQYLSIFSLFNNGVLNCRPCAYVDLYHLLACNMAVLT